MVDSVGSFGLVVSILSSSFLEREFVDDVFIFEFDVVEYEIEDVSEGYVERLVYEFNILVFVVEFVVFVINFNVLGSNVVVKVMDIYFRDSFEKGLFLVMGLGEFVDDFVSFEGFVEFIGSFEEFGVGDIVVEGVFGDVGVGDVENDVEVNGSDVVGGIRVFEYDGDLGLGVIERVGISVGSDNVGVGVVGIVVGIIEESFGDVGDISYGLFEERLIVSGVFVIYVVIIVGDFVIKVVVEGVVVRGDGGFSINRKGVNYVFLRDRFFFVVFEDDDMSIFGRLSCIVVDVVEDLGFVEV